MVIKQRLSDLGLGQRELARVAEVTESYVSQLLTRRRLPPAPNRTDIYEKMDAFLQLPRGELAKLAAHQRMAHVKRELGELAAPLFGNVRALVLRKCQPRRELAVRAIFEQQPFGELERLVTTTLINVVKRVARAELRNERWLRSLARASGKTFAEMRTVALEFLDTDILHVSPKSCADFLEPLIASWDIELANFALEVVLNPKTSANRTQRFHFHFAERARAGGTEREPGFAEFVADRSLSEGASRQELAHLEGLRFDGRQPTKFYYYRELQSLQDALHFRERPPREPAGVASGRG